MNKPKAVVRTSDLDSAAEQIGISREELMIRLEKVGIDLAARSPKTLTASEIEKIKNTK